MQAQVEGDVLPRPPPVGHEDDLDAVTQLAVACGAEHLLQGVGLGLG